MIRVGCIGQHSGRVDYYVYFFFQAEDGIRDLVRSRGLGDVYKRQAQFRLAGSVLRVPLPLMRTLTEGAAGAGDQDPVLVFSIGRCGSTLFSRCLLYTSDAADERSSVDLGGRRIIKKNKNNKKKKTHINTRSTITRHHRAQATCAIGDSHHELPGNC